MSDIANDGGPAFPLHLQSPTTGPETYYGMTLRAWLSGQALAAVIADAEMFDSACNVAKTKGIPAATGIAQAALEIADALLAELAKGKP